MTPLAISLVVNILTLVASVIFAAAMTGHARHAQAMEEQRDGWRKLADENGDQARRAIEALQSANAYIREQNERTERIIAGVEKALPDEGPRNPGSRIVS